MIKLLFIFFMLIQLNLACAKRNYIDDSTSSLISNTNQDQCQCFFIKEKICLQIQWESQPSSNNFSSLIMTFTKENSDERIDPINTPFVMLWMSSMGHGSTPVTMEKISIGEYRASNIYFVMPGTWDVRFQLKRGNAILEQYVQTITI